MSEFSRRERQILDILFERGEATATQIRQAMPDGPADATVRTILRILEEKGAVKHRQDGKKYIYRPRKKKANAGKSAMRRVLDVFYGGSLKEALAAHFADPKTKLDEETIDQIRGLIEQADGGDSQAKPKLKENKQEQVMIETLCQNLTPWQMAGLLLFIQTTVMVGLAWLVHVLLNRSPAKQHFVWLAALTAIGLALPIQWLVPGLQFEFEQSREVAKELSGEPELIVNNEFDSQVPDSSLTENRNPSTDSNLIIEPMIKSGGQAAMNHVPVDTLFIDARQRETSRSIVLPSWVQSLSVLYLLGVGFMMFRLIGGWIYLRRLFASCQPLVDSRSVGLMDEICCRLCLKRKPKTLVSSEVETPLAFGILRPTIMLPLKFGEWSESCQRVVLAHELCHVKRRDAVWDLLARVLGAIYWLHPAVHFSGKSLRKVRETATDIQVLSLDLGISASDYARELLHLTSGVVFPRKSVPVLPMAGQQDFRDRIENILAWSNSSAQTTKSRYSLVSLLFRLLILVLFLSIAGTSIRLSIAANTRPLQELAAFPGEVDDMEVVGADFYSRVLQTRVNLPQQGTVTKQVSVRGIIRDSQGNPVVNGIVIVRNAAAMSAREGSLINGVFGKTRTNKDGEFSITCAVPNKRYWNLAVVAFSEAGETGWQSIFRNDQTAVGSFSVNLRLFESVPINARLVDSDGNPVGDALVRVSTFARQVPEGQLFGEFNERVISPTTVSDENGLFEFPSLPQEQNVYLQVQHPDFPRELVIVATSEMEPRYSNPGSDEFVEVCENGSAIELDRGVAITGKIVGSDSNPLVDALVQVSGQVSKTNEDGGFEIRIKQETLESREQTSVTVIHPDYASATFRRSCTGLISSTGTSFQMVAAAEISGKVVAENDGEPLSNISLLISSSNGIRRTLSTDKQGEYSLLVAPGDITVQVQGVKPGFILVPDDRELEPGDDARLIRTVKLATGESKQLEPLLIQRIKGIEVRVVDAQGEPVGGAHVRLMSENEYGGYEQNGDVDVTAQDGIVDLQPIKDIGADPKTSLILATAIRESEGRLDTVLIGESTLEPEATTEISLVPATKVRGKVTWNGAPLAGVKVRVNSSSPTILERRPGGPTIARRSFRYTVGTVATDANGEYQLSVPKQNRLGNPGIYDVGVESGVPNEMARSISKELKLNAEGIYEFDVEFHSGDAEINGVLTDSEGNPIRNGSIIVTQALSDDSRLLSIQPTRFYFPVQVKTDEDGKFNMTGLPDDHKIQLRFLVSDDHPLVEKLQSREGSIEVSTGGGDLRLQLQLKRD